MADGSITFDTSLDNTQLEKDLKKAENEVDGLKRKIEKASRDKSAIEQELEGARQAAEEAKAAVDELVASSGYEDEPKLAQAYRDAGREVTQLQRSLDGITEKQDGISERFESESDAVEKAMLRVQELRDELAGLKAANPTDPAEAEQIAARARELREEISQANADITIQNAHLEDLGEEWRQIEGQAEEYRKQLETATANRDDLGTKREAIAQANAALKQQEREVSKIETRWETANRRIETHNRDLKAAKGRASALGKAYGEAMTQANSATTRATEAMRGAFDQMGQRINTMIKRVFVFQVALSALRGLRDSIAAALMENDRFSASVAALKASFQGVVNYVANAVAPAIIGMVNAAASAIINLAKLIDSLFGTSIVKSIAQARQAAEAAWRGIDAEKEAAKNLGKEGKAAKKLGKEAERASKSLMGFDEINQLSADTADDAADAIGDEADGLGGIDEGPEIKPEWDAFDVGKISEKLSEIMLILGAAIMAVGAILCFSGINIPLGITLMVIGALMIYAAYKENWDKLPEEVRTAITGMLVLAGITLLMIGAILALSGANIPLGVGMMIAGALLLWTAVALNWNDMPEQIRTVVSVIMGALGLALLAVGAVLAFSGANVPLGVALMAVGALSLAAAVGLNWNALSGSVEEAVSTILLALAAAAIVVGAVLAFSGVNLPLGIALMAAGAVALGSAVALRWNTLPSEVKAVVSAIMAIVAVASLVLGAVLTFSGANMTLGIGLLILGATTLATVAALNWETMPEGIRRVVTAIMAIVGVALLVLGAVICFTGAYLPLGIALLAAGAASLAAAAALNWNALPSGIRGVVNAIMAIVGTALVVLGVVLLFTGAGIPIGLGLLVAGGASLAAAIAPNWGYIRDNVQRVWNDLTTWWHQNAGRVFTFEFWAGIFKSIINGLIWCVNSGLDTFGWFINNISSGVCSLLDFFGVDGYSFTISMPQIPYLAQGAVIPPNREFMAVLGDQRHGNNIEAPESLMRQVVREEAGAMLSETVRALMTMGGMQQDQGGRQGDLVLMVDGREFGRVAMRGIMDLDATGELGGELSLRYS